MSPAKRTARAGFSLIEVLLVLALTVVMVVKASMLMGMTSQATRQQESTMVLEEQARRLLDRIAFAIISSDRETLFPDPASPAFTSELRYQISLGVEDGQVVWSDLERIGLAADNDSQVVWSTNTGEARERRLVWCNLVRPFLEGELANGIDDNGNGLVDEKGLSFVLDRDCVVIRLTLQREDSQGLTMIRSVQTMATCRN